MCGMLKKTRTVIHMMVKCITVYKIKNKMATYLNLVVRSRCIISDGLSMGRRVPNRVPMTMHLVPHSYDVLELSCGSAGIAGCVIAFPNQLGNDSTARCVGRTLALGALLHGVGFHSSRSSWRARCPAHDQSNDFLILSNDKTRIRQHVVSCLTTRRTCSLSAPC